MVKFHQRVQVLEFHSRLWNRSGKRSSHDRERALRLVHQRLRGAAFSKEPLSAEPKDSKFMCGLYTNSSQMRGGIGK
jgi:hypothetical protein